MRLFSVHSSRFSPPSLPSPSPSALPLYPFLADLFDIAKCRLCAPASPTLCASSKLIQRTTSLLHFSLVNVNLRLPHRTLQLRRHLHHCPHDFRRCKQIQGTASAVLISLIECRRIPVSGSRNRIAKFTSTGIIASSSTPPRRRHRLEDDTAPAKG